MKIHSLLQENKDYFDDFVTRATYQSNKIEGNTLSLATTRAILCNEKNVKITAEPREIYEVINHKSAVDFMLSEMGGVLAEGDIIGLAKRINQSINDMDGYRTTQVMILGANHVPPSPHKIKQQMMYFVHNYENTVFSDVFEKIARNHIEFERIHPFVDGNGRTGRLLIWWEMIKNNLPPAVITAENRIFYMECIEKQDSPALADLLRSLSEEERKRIAGFTLPL